MKYKRIIVTILTILFFSCNSHIAEKKEVKSALEKAYFQITQINELSNTENLGLPLFGANFATGYQFGMWWLLIEKAKTISMEKGWAEFVPENIEVDYITEDSVNVSYDLKFLEKNELRSQEHKTLLARKIGDEWKFDADKFFPSVMNKNSDSNNKENKRVNSNEMGITLANVQEMNKRQMTILVTAPSKPGLNDEKYYLNNQQVDFDVLEPALKVKIEGLTNPVAVLKLDKSLTVEDLVNILMIGDELKIKMVLATQPKSDK